MAVNRQETLASIAEDLFDFLSEAVLIIDGSSGEIQALNMAAAELFDLSSSELPDEKIYSLLKTNGEKPLKELLEGNPWKLDQELELLRGTGKGQPVNVCWQQVSGGVVMLTVQFRPSASMDAQDQFRVVNDDLVTLMAGSLAHDLNNIIGVLSGSLATLKRDPAHVAGAERRVDLLEKSVARAMSINSELMGYARRGESKMLGESLADGIQEVVREAQEVLPQDYEITLNVEENLPEFSISKVHLKGVLLSLILNSWQAMNDGGTIQVRAYLQPDSSNVTCARGLVLPGGDYIVVEVSDDGPGVPDQLKDRVFEPFYSTNSSGEGGGLGLTAVDRIVRSHGGGIRLLDAKSGACFELRFPVAR